MSKKVTEAILRRAGQDSEFRESLLKTAGGEFFSDYGTGTDPRRVFDYLKEEARYEYGSRGYTGSIAEKDGFEIRSRTPMSEAEALDFIKEDGGNNSKWGDAFAIPVAQTKAISQKEMTVQVRANNRREARTLGLEALKKRRGRKSKTSVVSARITDMNQMAAGSGAQIDFRRVTGGTAYYTTSGVGWVGRHNSKADASKAAREELSRDGIEVGREVKITKSVLIGVMSKSGEGNLWEIKGMQTVSKKGTKIEGWYFYGWASS